MPTYEYRCNACNREFEYQQRMADPDHVKCDVCGEDKLEKLISRTAFQLKGGGWYKDLYASNPKEASKDSVDKGVPPNKTEAPAAAAASSASSSDSGGSSLGSSSSSSDSGSSSSSSSSSSGGTSGGPSSSSASGS